MAWFKKTRKPMDAPDKASRVPEGLWVKCPACQKVIYNKDLVAACRCVRTARITSACRPPIA
jgi:acetyl-CoA carboxylase beta subunit